MKLGGHLRASEGLAHVVVNARALGYNVIQIMLCSGRDYAPREVEANAIKEYQQLTYGIETYVHLPYVINPCEAMPRRRAWYRKSYREHGDQAAALGAKAMVLHPGFKKDLDEDTARRNMMKFIEDAHKEEWNLDILLETDAGSKNGSKIGSPEFIHQALTEMQHPRAAMCIDTTHLYARGLNVFEPEVLEALLEKHAHHTKLVHLNCPDHNVGLGSFLDRHNTPFEDRPELDATYMIKRLTADWPCILERSSLAVQAQDNTFIRGLVEEADTAA